MCPECTKKVADKYLEICRIRVFPYSETIEKLQDWLKELSENNDSNYLHYDCKVELINDYVKIFKHNRTCYILFLNWSDWLIKQIDQMQPQHQKEQNGYHNDQPNGRHSQSISPPGSSVSNQPERGH